MAAHEQPASTVQVMSCHACSRSLQIRIMPSSMSGTTGFPQPSLVPLPLGITVNPLALANRITSATCCTSAGTATTVSPRTIECSAPTIAAR